MLLVSNTVCRLVGWNCASYQITDFNLAASRHPSKVCTHNWNSSGPQTEKPISGVPAEQHPAAEGIQIQTHPLPTEGQQAKERRLRGEITFSHRAVSGREYKSGLL